MNKKTDLNGLFDGKTEIVSYAVQLVVLAIISVFTINKEIKTRYKAVNKQKIALAKLDLKRKKKDMDISRKIDKAKAKANLKDIKLKSKIKRKKEKRAARRNNIRDAVVFAANKNEYKKLKKDGKWSENTLNYDTEQVNI